MKLDDKANEAQHPAVSVCHHSHNFRSLAEVRITMYVMQNE